MKNIILSICITICISCKNNTSSKDSFNNQILGEWVLVKGLGVSFNVCPKLIFKNEGKGNVIKPSGEIVDFTYTLDLKNKVNFSFKKDEEYFIEDKFNYEYHVDESFEKLVLKTEIEGNEYSLSRKKKNLTTGTLEK
ncbi:hypothetical protein TPENAI_60323 [Tenacibaculum litopenaei]|uniref:hypothetical protein n=1 Tax=Tenacibaculum litopenaei TaxID=396016 RepID=UPI0038945704